PPTVLTQDPRQRKRRGRQEQGAGAAEGRKTGPGASRGSDPEGGRGRPVAPCVRIRVASPSCGWGPCSASSAAPHCGDATDRDCRRTPTLTNLVGAAQGSPAVDH